MSTKTDINNADHPYRAEAIDILEHIQERVDKTADIKGELWYELEDYITFKIRDVRAKH